MKTRKVYKFVTKNKEIPSAPEARDGFGYIIIPSDIDRSDYIRNVYLTGQCMILTTYNTPIRSVAVPISMIQELVFPYDATGRGSLITYSYYKDQPCIQSIHLKPNESFMYRENTYVDERRFNSTTMSDIKALEAGNWLISIDDKESSSGKIIITAKGETDGSVIEVGLDGNISIKCSDSINTKTKNGINDISDTRSIEASTSVDITVIGEETSSVIKVTSAGVSVVSESIALGIEPVEKAILGDETKAQLQSVINSVDKIIQAIRSSAVFAGDGGASFKTNLIASLSSYAKANLDGILSENVTLK